MSVEDLAIKTVCEFGKRANYNNIYSIMSEHGFRDEDGELAGRIMEMISTAIVRVKVRYAG